jgi:hypothetical protein
LLTTVPLSKKAMGRRWLAWLTNHSVLKNLSLILPKATDQVLGAEGEKRRDPFRGISALLGFDVRKLGWKQRS